MASAIVGHDDGVSHLMAVHEVGDVLRAGDALVVEADDEVSAEIELQLPM